MNPAVLLSGSGWTPRRLPRMLAWFDATVGVTAIAGGVSQWNDQSGNGFHITQSTATNRPTYQATGWNSNKPAVFFDGSNDFLASTAAGFADYANGNNPPLSLLMTINAAFPGGFKTIAEWVNDPTATSATDFAINNSDHIFPNHNNVGPAGSITIVGSNRRIGVMTSGGTADAYVDGTLDINGGSFNSVTSSQNRFLMGMSDLGTNFYSGVIAELIICAQRLGSGEFNAYRSYSNAKFGA